VRPGRGGAAAPDRGSAGGSDSDSEEEEEEEEEEEDSESEEEYIRIQVHRDHSTVEGTRAPGMARARVASKTFRTQ